MPKHYGAVITPEELAAQKAKSYPGVMAPEGTWQHWFWHSKILHTCITIGTLFVLGLCTFFMHYATYSPYKDLVPPISDLWTRPFHYFSMWKHVIILHEQHKNVRATEEKLARQNDNMKQRYYRKMHGIEEKNPIHSVFGKPQDDKTDAQIEADALGRELTEEEMKEVKPERKKWLGIW